MDSKGAITKHEPHTPWFIIWELLHDQSIEIRSGVVYDAYVVVGVDGIVKVAKAFSKVDEPPPKIGLWIPFPVIDVAEGLFGKVSAVLRFLLFKLLAKLKAG